MTWARGQWVVVGLASLLLGCSESDSGGGSGGNAANAGSAGFAAGGSGGGAASGGAAGGGGTSGTSGTAGAGASAGSGGQQSFNPRFPRVAAYPIGGPQSAVATEAFRAWAAKHAVVILSQWPGWSQSGMSMADVMQDIKARSTIGTKLFVYVNMGEIAKVNADPGNAGYEKYQALLANHWFLYENGLTFENPVDSWYGGGTHAKINYTSFGVKVSGEDWMEWFTKYSLGFIRDGAPTDSGTGPQTNAPNPYVDGFFMDNVFWEERPPLGDWNRDGSVDAVDDSTTRSWVEAGYKAYFDYVREQWPASTQIGNTADWPGALSANQPLGVYDQLLDGGVMEGLLGESWSPESYSGFVKMMQNYRFQIDAFRAPKLALFGHNALAEGDYQTLRYGLAATLMDDGYYAVAGTNGYSPADQLWFDEFDVELGYPVDPRQEQPWLQGVWRREFEQGIVLVNPKGNGAQTVELGSTFKKISGTQDPSVNDGSTATSVTLKDHDGLILLK